MTSEIVTKGEHGTYGKIYRKHINEYNTREEYHDHYIDLGDKEVMIITWNQVWSFKVFIMEDMI